MSVTLSPHRSDPSAFEPLPVPLSASMAPRRVGVEVEFMGIGAHAAATALQAAFGGEVIEEDPHAFIVRTDRLGVLGVELDIRYAHPERGDPTVPVRLPSWAGRLLGSALVPFVPRELVTPPLLVEQLDEADLAIAALRDAGATGDRATRTASLGLHFNVDPPDLEPSTLVRYVRAYLTLEGRLRRGIAGEGGAPPAAPFPRSYARLVLDPGYRPDVATLVADYLAHNPTRDRGLDMLPILLHLDPARVRAVLPHAKIGGRPVLHHRLPLARVGVPGWGIAGDWSRWVAVERLAADPQPARALSSAGRRAPALGVP